MANKTYTPSWELVRPSLNLTRSNTEQILFIVILPALVALLGSLLYRTHLVVGLTILTIGIALEVINSPISYYLQLKVITNKNLTTKDCYKNGFKYWFKIIIFQIFFTAIIIIGFILLILPGAILYKRYFLTPYTLIDSNLSIREAMQKTAKMVKPANNYVWGTLGVYLAFSMAGLFLSVVPIIGSILTLLISLIFYFGPALRYQELKSTRL